MLQTMQKGALTGIALGTGTLTSGTAGYTKAYKPSADVNDFGEVAVMLTFAAFSATPDAESILVELQHSDDPAEADDYAVPTPVEAEVKQRYGPVANGGGGETIASSVLMFHFAPGKFKAGTRLKMTVSTTAGTETIGYDARLIGMDPREFPVAQIPAAAVVTPS